MTLVVHCRRAKYDVLCDRTTPFGNPFSQEDRVTNITQFYQWLVLNRSLLARAKRELTGKTMACWCYPKPCHCMVYDRLVNGNLSALSKIKKWPIL